MAAIPAIAAMWLAAAQLTACTLAYIGMHIDAGETMISGYTGEAFRTDIFIGPVYYQRLRHMVSDKFQVNLDCLVLVHFR